MTAPSRRSRKSTPPPGGRSETAKRLAFLSLLRPILSGADSSVMLQRVARLASRTLCEYCVVDLVDEARHRVGRLEIAHADALLFDRLRAEAGAFVPSPGGRIERVLASRTPELVAIARPSPMISGTRMKALRSEAGASLRPRASRPGEDALDFWESFVPASYMTVPIECAGQIVAVMTFASSRTPLRFDEERLAFACEVAAWCGLALKGAHPVDAPGAADNSSIRTVTTPVPGRRRA